MVSIGKVLISGAGIAGLTLAIRLKEYGYEPLVVERDSALPEDGYMMDFFGTGWDVAERMGLADKLNAIRYPIDKLQFVNAAGRSYASVRMWMIKRVLGGKYVYLRRSDLVRILSERAKSLGIEIRYGSEIIAIEEDEEAEHVTAGFGDGSAEDFALIFGADGVHSDVRTMVFGEERQFARFLGVYIAAFHLKDHDLPIGRAVQIHEEPNRIAAYYPLGPKSLDALYMFRLEEVEVPRNQQLAFVRRAYKNAGWLGEVLLDAYPGKEPILFDTLTQIAMPRWSRGRVVLLGDACGCLTLLAGQGSHMAMAGAYVLAQELKRYNGNHMPAFTAYEAMLKPAVAKRQEDAAALAKLVIPSSQSKPWLRRLAITALFNPLVLPFVFRALGSKSILPAEEEL